MLLSSCLCRGEDGKPFCLAELWPWRNTPSHFTTSNPTFWSFWAKLQNFTLAVLPFRRIKRTNVQSLHWSFGFIEIFTINAVHAFQNTQKTYFGFTHASCKDHFGSSEGLAFYWSVMTADSDTIKYRCANSCMTGQVWFSKSRSLSASVSFLFPHPFLPHPTPLLGELNWLPVKEQLF